MLFRSDQSLTLLSKVEPKNERGGVGCAKLGSEVISTHKQQHVEVFKCAFLNPGCWRCGGNLELLLGPEFDATFEGRAEK
mgnify:CR=1 FL=1